MDIWEESLSMGSYLGSIDYSRIAVAQVTVVTGRSSIAKLGAM